MAPPLSEADVEGLSSVVEEAVASPSRQVEKCRVCFKPCIDAKNFFMSSINQLFVRRVHSATKQFQHLKLKRLGRNRKRLVYACQALNVHQPPAINFKNIAEMDRRGRGRRRGIILEGERVRLRNVLRR